MSTPEAKVKAKIKTILKDRNIYFVMPMGTGYGNSGVPDFICCVSGCFLAIEAKTQTNKPTALQEKNLRLIQKGGGVALVINETNIGELEAYINDVWAYAG
jgi:Holliday junction resolvase